jgi:hypothetical protein
MRHETPAQYAYWIVCPKTSAMRPNLARFEAWLLSQAEPEGRGAA